jgi:hypothetical protein
VEGAGGQKKGESSVEYNDFGEPTVSRVVLAGSAPLVRGTTKKFPDGTAITPAATPTTAVRDGTIEVSRTIYDRFGNVVATVGAGNRCAEVAYDPEHAQLPMAEKVFVGQNTSRSLGGQSFVCGHRKLTATAYYDRGLQALGSTTVNAKRRKSDTHPRANSDSRRVDTHVPFGAPS